MGVQPHRSRVIALRADMSRPKNRPIQPKCGSDYGLCQVHATEIWHHELVVEPGTTCPPAS